MDIEEIKDFVYEVRTFGITSNDAKFVQITEYLLSELEKEKEKNKDLKEGYKIQEHNYQVAMEEIEQRWKDIIIAKVIEIKDRPVKDEFITATQGRLNTIIDIESLLDEEE